MDSTSRWGVGRVRRDHRAPGLQDTRASGARPLRRGLVRLPEARRRPLSSPGARNELALEVETIEAAKRMVERGLGLAFLPHLAVAGELRRRSLVAVEIADAEPLRRSLDVIHPLHRPLSVEALAFLEALRAVVRE
ncbi:MAG: hypothetical protein HYV62_06280, partial [Candidatus Rokubacteria bacterium]|nr:hypothetical protein [Candidatus Rokubacteria bacterium]